jgi:thiol:disulfide interchange protein
MLRRPLGFALITTLTACSSERALPPTIVIASGAPAPPVEPATASSSTQERAPRQAPPIAWETSEAGARERARRVGLPLLVWVRADWDAASLEMERKTWADLRVREVARPFVALRLDVTEAAGDAERYAERYEVKVIPMTILFDARGQRFASLPGFQDALPVAAALRRASE